MCTGKDGAVAKHLNLLIVCKGPGVRVSTAKHRTSTGVYFVCLVHRIVVRCVFCLGSMSCAVVCFCVFVVFFFRVSESFPRVQPTF